MIGMVVLILQVVIELHVGKVVGIKCKFGRPSHPPNIWNGESRRCSEMWTSSELYFLWSVGSSRVWWTADEIDFRVVVCTIGWVVVGVEITHVGVPGGRDA